MVFSGYNWMRDRTEASPLSDGHQRKQCSENLQGLRRSGISIEIFLLIRCEQMMFNIHACHMRIHYDFKSSWQNLTDAPLTIQIPWTIWMDKFVAKFDLSFRSRFPRRGFSRTVIWTERELLLKTAETPLGPTSFASLVKRRNVKLQPLLSKSLFQSILRLV